MTTQPPHLSDHHAHPGVIDLDDARARRIDARKLPWHRDPRRFPYGLLLAEGRPLGGANGFAWFSNQAEAIAFLRVELWNHLPPSAETDSARRLLQPVLTRASDLDASLVRDALSGQDDIVLVWHGTFDSLLEGRDAFTAGVLEEFHEHSGRDTAPREALEEFIASLSRFRGQGRFA